MYFPPSDIIIPEIGLKDCYIVKMINKAVNKIKIQHEWGHGSSSHLFMNYEIKYFTAPERNIKFKEKSESKYNIKKISEGGKVVEFLLYKRVIMI